MRCDDCGVAIVVPEDVLPEGLAINHPTAGLLILCDECQRSLTSGRRDEGG